MREQNCPSDEINLMDYIKVMIRQRKMIIGIAVICVAASIVLTLSKPAPVKLYEINSTIRIGSIEGNLLTVNEAIEKLKNRNVLEDVISETGADITIEDLKDAVKIEKIADTNLLKLQIRSVNPDMAVKILNKIGDKFVADGNKLYEINVTVLKEQVKSLREREQILSGRIDILKQKMSDSKEQPAFLSILETLTRCESIYSGLDTTQDSLESILFKAKNFEIVEPPAESIIAAAPQKKKQKIVIAAILGLMLGVFVAFFKDFWHRNARRLMKNS